MCFCGLSVSHRKFYFQELVVPVFKKYEVSFKAKSELLVPVLRVNVISNFGMPFSLHGLPDPFRRRFPALPCGVMAGYPMQTVMRFSRFDEGL
jgi:hypothetical protein